MGSVNLAECGGEGGRSPGPPPFLRGEGGAESPSKPGAQ